MPKSDKHGLSPWRLRLHVIIFEADTPAGKAFDMALLVAILSSIIVVMLDSVEDIASRYGALLGALEWMFTILFTIEYVLRLVSVSRPLRYVFSFYGVIDLMAILPTYLSLIMSGAESLLVLRSLR
ncbi:MAG: ion transporter, partial [SAR324 cluster bacterium]|nr:ion transporter [SAR324 cluster bacterium]